MFLRSLGNSGLDSNVVMILGALELDSQTPVVLPSRRTTRLKTFDAVVLRAFST